MSLYDHDEVCENCVFARWIPGDQFWDRKPRFSQCGLGREEEVDPIRGKCEFRQITADRAAPGKEGAA